MPKRWTILAGVTAAIVLGALGAGADDKDTPSIKDVMKKLHKGANAPIAKLKTQLKADKPAWKDIQDEAKDFVILGAALGKNDPPKGDKENWKTLTDSYYENAKALDDAAQKESK